MRVSPLSPLQGTGLKKGKVRRCPCGQALGMRGAGEGKPIAKGEGVGSSLEGRDAMKTSRRNAVARLPKRIVTTLGDLISAAYDAAGGFGRQRVERAAVILTAPPLARRMSRHLQFVP